MRFCLDCPPDALRIPAAGASGPADGLWQHTCCEAFIADEQGDGYLEFNFSPSGQWACYRFLAYRQRDTAFTPPAAPSINCHTQPAAFVLTATIPPALLPGEGASLVGLTAVIETADGRKSYWATTHCAAQPDFHLRQSFTLNLNRNQP